MLLRQAPPVAGEHDLLAQCLITAGPDQELILGVLAVVNVRSLESNIYVNSVSFNNTHQQSGEHEPDRDPDSQSEGIPAHGEGVTCGRRHCNRRRRQFALR
jgi:hypothetical protein